MIWFSKFYPSNLQYFFSTSFWGRGWGLKNGSCKRTGSLSGILSSIARVSVDYCRIVSLAILRQLRSWRSDGLMLNSFIYFCFVWSKCTKFWAKHEARFLEWTVDDHLSNMWVLSTKQRKMLRIVCMVFFGLPYNYGFSLFILLALKNLIGIWGVVN